MKRTPQWWSDLPITKRLRKQIRSILTLTRDGYVIWYRGKPRNVCGKKTPPADVLDIWAQKQKLIDAGLSTSPVAKASGDKTYRDVLSEFLAACETRVKTRKPKPMSPRTLHNYSVDLNALGAFVYDDVKVADMPIVRANSPAIFAAFAGTYTWKASGWDSVVSRVGALFNWAVEMEYLDRYRPGPTFRRPAKADIRDDRIELAKTYTPEAVGKLWAKANGVMRCWIALGLCAGFNNSDIGHLTRSVVDLDTGVIDFRRRKSGKMRRVIPLPSDVVKLLKHYRRPEPTDATDSDLFFVTEYGHGYSGTRKRDGKPSCSISRLFAKLIDASGITAAKGQNFSGLRTSFYNLAPRHTHAQEVDIIMGHAHGRIDLDHYLETLHLLRLREVVNHVWNQITPHISTSQAGAATSPVEPS